MNDPELYQLLEKVRDEIEAAQSVDEQERALLRDLDADIRELLERCETEQAQTHPHILERLEEAVDSLAVNHPTLTATLSNMLTTLSNAGV